MYRSSNLRYSSVGKIKTNLALHHRTTQLRKVQVGLTEQAASQPDNNPGAPTLHPEHGFTGFEQIARLIG